MTDFRSTARGALLGLLCTGAVAVAMPNNRTLHTDAEAKAGIEVRDDDLSSVRGFLGRGTVRAEMARFGVEPAEAMKRAAALTDEELRQLATGLNLQPAATSVAEAVSTVFVVLLILELVSGQAVLSSGGV